jgi:hypothetical protein
MRIGWLANAEHFITTTPFPKSHIYQPPNVHVQISGIFAKQRNGGSGREKDLLRCKHMINHP